MTTGEQLERHPDDLDAEPGPSDMMDARVTALGIDLDGGPVRARAKGLAAWGAITLWIVSPLLIGGFITAAVHVADHGGAHGLAMAGFVAWAFVCFVVMSLGFLMLMGGVYLWWRSRNPCGRWRAERPTGGVRPCCANCARNCGRRTRDPRLTIRPSPEVPVNS